MTELALVTSAPAGAASARDATQILLEVTALMTEVGGDRSALSRLAELALRATGADRSAIFVRDAEGGGRRLCPVAGACAVGDAREQWSLFRRMGPIDASEGATGAALWSLGEVVTIDDVSASPLIPEAWRDAWGSRSLAIAPLLAAGENHGFLVVEYWTRQHRFTSDEARLLDAISSAAGVALRGARLRASLEMRLRVIEALHRLGAIVGRTSDLKAVVTALNREIGAEMGVEFVRLAFGDPELATLLRLKPASEHEQELLRRWAGRREPPEVRDRDVLLPVPLGARVAGVLTMRAARALDRAEIELAEAVAGGLGEVALKAKLRRTADRRSRQLAVAAERERIARGLHDTLGQTLYGISLKLHEALEATDDPALAHTLAEVRGLAGRAIGDMRSTVYTLSSLNLSARGFAPSLRALARQFERTTGITAELRLAEPQPRLDAEAESALYLVVHEALVNVDRHARATGIVITLGETDGSAVLTIRDDGVDLDQRDAPDWRSAAHFGMRLMARTVERLGGRLTVLPMAPRGLLIKAVLPARAARGRRA